MIGLIIIRQIFNKNYGFAEINYHEKFYIYCIDLLREIKENFSYYEKFNTDYLNKVPHEYFDVELIAKLHKNFIDEIFSDITIIQLYKFLNLQHLFYKPRVSRDQLNILYFLLFRLSSKANNKEWLPIILRELDIKISTYKSKYKSIISSKKDSHPDKMYKRIIEII